MTDAKITEKMVSMKEYKESIAFMADIVKQKVKQISELEKSEKELKNSLSKTNELLKLYKSLADNNAIYVKTYSQDCDGVCNYSNYEFASITEYEVTYESWCDSIEGSCSWEIVPNKEALLNEEDCGTFGQGWGIN